MCSLRSAAMRPAEQESARHWFEQSTMPGTALWLLRPPATSNFHGKLRRLNQSAKPHLSIRKHQSVGNHQSGRRHPTSSRSAIAFRKSPHQPAAESVRPRPATSPGDRRPHPGTHQTPRTVQRQPTQEPLGDTPSGTTERVSVSPDGIASSVVASLHPMPKQAIFSDFVLFSAAGDTPPHSSPFVSRHISGQGNPVFGDTPTNVVEVP